MSEEVVVKKKRGRKPKIKEETTVVPCSIDTKTVKNSVYTQIDKPCILHLLINSDNSQAVNVHNYENRFCEYDPNIIEPNAYESTTQFQYISGKDIGNSNTNTKVGNNDNLSIYDLDNNLLPNNTCTACYWCCHTFSNTPYGIPLKYLDEKFYCYGCFCSLECAAAYNLNYNDMNINVWESYNLLNLLAKKYKYKNMVYCAPKKQLLRLFGGKLNIDEYRNLYRKDNIVTFNTYPMISIVDNVEEINEFSRVNDIDLTFSSNDTFSFKLDKLSDNLKKD